MQALKLKAAMKNPDEFYFAMHRKKTEGGVHVLDGAETLPHDVVQVCMCAEVVGGSERAEAWDGWGVGRGYRKGQRGGGRWTWVVL